MVKHAAGPKKYESLKTRTENSGPTADSSPRLYFMAEKKLVGPASYFPSIEKKYGKPIEYWLKELRKVSKLAHMEQVSHLKVKFEMGHGHANALVAYFRRKNES